MCYGEYFPSPGPLANSPGPYSEEAHQQLNSMVSERMAFFAEALGTLILALVVFAVTDARNSGGPGGRLAPVFIGLTVSALISVIAPLTQACFNPARDFGPAAVRLFRGLGQHRHAGPHAHRVFHGLHRSRRSWAPWWERAIYDLVRAAASPVPAAERQQSSRTAIGDDIRCRPPD